MVVNMTEGLYPDFVGRRQIFAGTGKGPAVYNNVTGDVVTLSNPRLYIDAILTGGTFTTDGTYYALAQPIGGGGPRQQWCLRWFLAGGNTELANGSVAVANKTLAVAGFCGQF